MKTLFNLIRSIITSFLFIFLIIALIIQIIFSIVKIENKKLSDLINREDLYNLVLKDELLEETSKQVAIKYIDEYINYVFYKRSYPSIDINAIENITNQEKKIIIENIETLKTKIDLEYETILTIRNFNNFISNGSIFLILNVGIFTLFLVITIIYGAFNKSIKIFAIALILASLISLIGGSIISSILLNNANEIIVTFSKNIINKEFLKNFFNIILTNIILSLLFLLIIFVFKKNAKK